MGGVRPSPVSFFQEESLINMINSFGQISAKDGISRNPVASRKSKEKQLSANLSIIPTGSEAAKNLQKEAEEVKADAAQLQHMSDMVMNGKLQFNVNSELGSVIVKIVDPNTEQVIKEIPSEDIQKLKIRIRKTIGVLFDEMI